jgi:hypothetical protein
MANRQAAAADERFHDPSRTRRITAEAIDGTRAGRR